MFLAIWLVVCCISLGLVFCHLVEALGGKSDEVAQRTTTIAKASTTSALFLMLAGFLLLGAIFSETWESPLSCLLGYAAALGLAFVAGCFVRVSDDVAAVGSDATTASARCKSLEEQVKTLKKTLRETETQREGLKLTNDELRKSMDVQAVTIKKQYDSMSKEYFRLVEENERLKDLLQPKKSFESKKND